MIRQKIYLDTSVINFIFADDAPEKKEVTIELFDNFIVTGVYETIDHGVIPKKKIFDALHVAATVINKFDYLVSWNYKHLANVNRERRILALNYNLGYLHPIRIITPLELISYEK